MQCLQSRYSERQKLPRDVQHAIKHSKKHHMKEHKEFLARGQKDERSRQASLLESFQKQGKLPADNANLCWSDEAALCILAVSTWYVSSIRINMTGIFCFFGI